MRILGLDPGLRQSGWGVIEAQDSRIRHVANGTVASTASLTLAERLTQIFDGISAVVAEFAPAEAAVEETFANRNPAATLKLGQARGVVLLAPSCAGIMVAEYAPNRVKKAVVGVGHADKHQIAMMVGTLLPGIEIAGADAADALAVAICHAHYRTAAAPIAAALAAAGAHR